MRFAFIDIETTGGQTTRSRITEVAIKVLEDGEVIREWQTLINPQTNIPPFIQSLTGINNAMVEDAPVFSQVADDIDELTKDAIFVAHNARFDYGFIKSEFKRLDRRFQRRVLCTVKLAKALYPQYKSHGLDALIKRHHIAITERHRAMGDVDATIAFYHIAQQEIAPDDFAVAIQKQLKKPSLPKGLTEAQVNEIPDGPGVYRFYGENDALLYVGKSINLYQRVMSHFSSDHSSSKEMTISQSITHIDWTETAGDLGAQLLELKQIKTLSPILNRRSRPSKTLVTIRLDKNDEGYLAANLSRELDFAALDNHFGLYRSQSAAKKALVTIANKNQLCRKQLGLEKTTGPCFGYQTGSCQGACVGKEDTERYNLRTQVAFYGMQLAVWPFKGIIGIKETHPHRDWQQLHVIYNWCHLGTVTSDEALNDLLEHNLPSDADGSVKARVAFDLDTYKLLSKVILSPAFSLPIIEF